MGYNSNSVVSLDPVREDLTSSLSKLSKSLDNLLDDVAKLEERISPILVSRLDDIGEDKDASLGPRRSSFRIALDDETDKVKRLENIICKLINQIDL